MSEQEKTTQQRKKYAARGEAAQKMVSLRIDISLLRWLKSKRNMGRYINDLIRKDMKRAWVGDDDDEAQPIRGDYEDVTEHY